MQTDSHLQNNETRQPREIEAERNQPSEGFRAYAENIRQSLEERHASAEGDQCRAELARQLAEELQQAWRVTEEVSRAAAETRRSDSPGNASFAGR